MGGDFPQTFNQARLVDGQKEHLHLITLLL